MSQRILIGFFLLFLCTAVFSGISYGTEMPKEGDALFAQRADVTQFKNALLNYEKYFTKNDATFDQAIFLSWAYYYYGERYGKANPGKAINVYMLSVKWAEYALGKKAGDFEGEYLRDLCTGKAGSLKNKVKAGEAQQKAKEAFEKLIAKNPDRYESYQALGNLLLEAPLEPAGVGNREMAALTLKKAFSLAKENPEVALDYALALIEVGEYKTVRLLLFQIDTMPAIPNWKVESDRVRQVAKKALADIRGK